MSDHVTTIDRNGQQDDVCGRYAIQRLEHEYMWEAIACAMTGRSIRLDEIREAIEIAKGQRAP